MQRDRGCLSSLSPGEQRLLTLRAGLDGGSARSAATVARILHLSAAREARAEGRALGDLSGQADHGCRQGAAAASFAMFAGSGRAAMVSWITPALAPETGIAAGAGSSFSPATASGPVRVKKAAAKLASDLTTGVTRASGKTKSKHGSGQNNGVAVAINPSSSTTSLLPIVIALLALTGAGLLLWPLLQRRLRTANAADAGADGKPAPAANGANGATGASPASGGADASPANGAPVASAAASPDASPMAQSSAPSASAVLSPVGPAGATAAGAAAAGAAAGRGPATGAEEAAVAAPSSATPAPSPAAAPAPGPARAGRANGRRAAMLAVGSAAAMRGLRVALSRRRRQR